jgi:hypothetical protein
MIDNSIGDHSAFKNFYQGVPQEQTELLIRFRAAHLPRQVEVDGVSWKWPVGPEEYSFWNLIMTRLLRHQRGQP